MEFLYELTPKQQDYYAGQVQIAKTHLPSDNELLTWMKCFKDLYDDLMRHYNKDVDYLYAAEETMLWYYKLYIMHNIEAQEMRYLCQKICALIFMERTILEDE